MIVPTLYLVLCEPPEGWDGILNTYKSHRNSKTKWNIYCCVKHTIQQGILHLINGNKSSVIMQHWMFRKMSIYTQYSGSRLTLHSITTRSYRCRITPMWQNSIKQMHSEIQLSRMTLCKHKYCKIIIRIRWYVTASPTAVFQACVMWTLLLA